MKFASFAVAATLASTVSAFPWMAAEHNQQRRGIAANGLFDNAQVNKLVGIVKNMDPAKLSNLTTQLKAGMDQVNAQIKAAGVEIPSGKLLDKDWSSITQQDIEQAYGLRQGNATKRGLALWGLAEDDKHPWYAPRPGDLRGPCPGLNTAANHGYLPRSGVVNPLELFIGTWEALSLSPDLCAVLAALSFLFKGDLTTLTLSIGTKHGLGSGLADHGVLEGDASVTRDDHYFGNDYDAVPSKVALLQREIDQYGNGEVTPWSLAHSRKRAFDDSKKHNPNFDFNPWRMIVAYAESGFVMEALRGDSLTFNNEQIDWWFNKERFPPGWSRRAVPITIPELLSWAALIEALDPTIPGWSIFGVYTGDITTWFNIAGWFTSQTGAESTIAGVGCSISSIFLGWFPTMISNLFVELGLPYINGLGC